MANQNGNLITTPDVVPVTIKRLATKDGLGTAAAHIRLGDEFLVSLKSVGRIEAINQNGCRFEATTINIVDSNGKNLGWMYAELFFV